MTWAHVLSKAGAMSNPFEYKEIMAAAFQFGTTKTVEEVQAEHKVRHALAEREAESERKRGPLNAKMPTTTKAPELTATPKVSEMDKVKAMLANAPMRPKPLVDPDAE